MRPYNESFLHEIKRELAYIWAAHRLHKLDGKMRMFSPRGHENWKVAETGYEVWFGPAEIELVIKKVEIMYKEGHEPKTPLLLDPVVYRKLAGAKPIPLGSGVVWCTGLMRDGTKAVDPNAVKRLEKLGVFTDFYHSGDNPRAGIKALAFLEEAAMPMDKEFAEEGSVVPGVQQLADLLDIDSTGPYSRYYLLSDLEYTTREGTVYQNPGFQDIFHGTAITSIKDLEKHRIHLQHLLDTAKCWNSYQREQIIYERYGTDVANLERNLKSKIESDRMVSQVRYEMELLWAANKRCGLEGEMRIYSSPSQVNWRSKMAGTEIWFRDNEEDYKDVERKVQLHYNAGVLPNTPMLIDPVVYKRDENGMPTPLGTGVVWANCMCVGRQVYEPGMLARLKDIGLLTGFIIRAGEKESGLKAVGFLQEPFLFGEEDINEYKRQQYNEAAKEVMRARIEKERVEMAEQGYSEERERQFALHTEELMASVPNAVVVEVLPIPGCREIFDVSGANGEEYWQYYLTTGLEYLCTNGAFAAMGMEQAIPKTPEERTKLLEKFTLPLQRVLDAGNCWRAYDRLPQLWARFGMDAANLEQNLKYFNLCGRNLDFLNMTGEGRKNTVSEKFEFLIPGWLPKGSVTLLAGGGGTGKSSLVHRLALLTSSDWQKDDPNPRWLGSEISKTDCQGLTIYLSGEDSPGIMTARAEIMDSQQRSKRLMFKFGLDFGLAADNSGRDIADFLDDLKRLPQVDLVVIDPARKYVAKEGQDNDTANRFFDALEKFAAAKNCGVLIVHNLQREARPSRTQDMLDVLSGAHAFAERPRVVIGLLREGEKTVVGLAKNTMPPKMGMVEGERLFVRDPAVMDLLWLPGAEGVRRFDISAEDLAQIKAKAGKGA